MIIKEFKRIVNYHETDKMGIDHHSNYIKFMDEARVDFLDQIGWNYAELEEMEAISPVVNVNVNYKKPTTLLMKFQSKFLLLNIAELKLCLLMK